MTEVPADRLTAPTQGDAAATTSDLWLGAQLWWRRVERAGVTAGTSGVVRQPHQVLPLLAALIERRESATAHLGRNADRAAVTAPSVRILESSDIGTETTGVTTPHAPVSPGTTPTPTPAIRSGGALPLGTTRPSSPTPPMQGQVIQRRAVAANPVAKPRAAPVAAAVHSTRAARPSAAVLASPSGVIPTPRRAGPHRVGAPVKGAVADLSMRPQAGRSTPDQSRDATRAEPFAAAAVVSPSAAATPASDRPAIRLRRPTEMRSDATAAEGPRPPPASAATTPRATSLDAFDAKPLAQRATARQGPLRIGEAHVMWPTPSVAAQNSRMAPMHRGSMTAPTGAIAAPVASGSLPALKTLPLSVRAATMVDATAAASQRRQAAMPLPPAAIAHQPVPRLSQDAQAGIRPQVRSADAAPTSTAAPTGSIATRSREQARLGAREIGRVAESVYQLLVERLAQERQRRGA